MSKTTTRKRVHLADGLWANLHEDSDGNVVAVSLAGYDVRFTMTELKTRLASRGMCGGADLYVLVEPTSDKRAQPKVRTGDYVAELAK